MSIETLEDVITWIGEHEKEHGTLRERLLRETSSKAATDLKAATVHLESRLTAQDTELKLLRGETEKQTPLLEKTAKEFRANRRARHDRKVQEELYRTWMKRAVAVAIALGGLIEFLIRVKGN